MPSVVADRRLPTTSYINQDADRLDALGDSLEPGREVQRIAPTSGDSHGTDYDGSEQVWEVAIVRKPLTPPDAISVSHL